MSWADCGTDSTGRPIGYAVDAICDEPGCEKKVCRGLANACGGMHGARYSGCEGYFCYDHLIGSPVTSSGGGFLCARCAEKDQDQDE